MRPLETASGGAGGLAEEHGEGAASAPGRASDRLPRPLPSAGKEPGAGSAASPLPRAKSLRGAFMRATNADYAFLDEIKGCLRTPGPPSGPAAAPGLPQMPPGALRSLVFRGDQLQRRREAGGMFALAGSGVQIDSSDCCSPPDPQPSPRLVPPIPLQRDSSRAGPWDLLTS